MLTEVASALSSLKAAKDIIQGINAAGTASAVRDVQIPLQNIIFDTQQHLLAAQQEQLALSNRVTELEQEIVRLKNWQTDAERYEAADTGRGSLAYRVKAGMEKGEPAHWLCPTCFHGGKKSFLQPETLQVGRTEILRCPSCKTEIITRGMRMR